MYKTQELTACIDGNLPLKSLHNTKNEIWEHLTWLYPQNRKNGWEQGFWLPFLVLPPVLPVTVMMI